MAEAKQQQLGEWVNKWVNCDVMAETVTPASAHLPTGAMLCWLQSAAAEGAPKTHRVTCPPLQSGFNLVGSSL
jgi:hypothetical protein